MQLTKHHIFSEKNLPMTFFVGVNQMFPSASIHNGVLSKILRCEVSCYEFIVQESFWMIQSDAINLTPNCANLRLRVISR